MPRIAPQPQITNFKKEIYGFEKEEDDQLMEESFVQASPTVSERNVCLYYLLSIRLLLIVIITLVVMLTAFSIWVTSYTMNEQAAMEQVNEILINMNEKITNFVNSQLVPAKYVADSIVQDYNNGFIDMVDSIRLYMFHRIKLYGVTVINFCFGEETSQLFAYSVNADSSMIFARQLQNQRLVSYVANAVSGDYDVNRVKLNITYSVSKADYYLESIAITSNSSTSEGGFGKVYKVLDGPQSTFWSTPVYNRTDLASKKRIGFAKINVSLAAIAQFLAKIKVMERGYVIISEFGSNYIIGSSLTIDGIDEQRVKATNITSRGAGFVVGQLLNYQQANHLDDSSSITLSLMNENGESFLLNSSPYMFYNLKWRMIIVFDESEIKKGITQSSYVILGVTIGVTVFGILISIVIGFLLTNPLTKMQQDFKKIKVLDLVNIQQRSSPFSEAKSIYSSLTETVRWLSEIRAFIPSSVLYRLEQKQMSEVKEKPNANSLMSIGGVVSFHSSKIKQSIDTLGSQVLSSNAILKKDSLFKLGLVKKDCSIIYLTISNLNENNYDFESGLLSTLITRVIISISNICKTCKADLQIKSYNEFVILFTSEKNTSLGALETALKVTSLLTSLNDQLKKDKVIQISLNMGISSGNMIQGDVGNKQLRYFAMVGSIIERSKELNGFSCLLNVPIVCDSLTQKETTGLFIFRPIERILSDSQQAVETVFELVKKNVVNDDEWLYELEQKRINAQFDEFNSDFHKLFPKHMEHLEESELNAIHDRLVEASKNQPTDLVIQRMEHLVLEMKRSEHLASLSTYCTTVNRHLVSFVKPGEHIASLVYSQGGTL